MTDPTAKQQLGLPQNASEAEVAAQVEKMMGGAFAATNVRSMQPAIKEAIGGNSEPWSGAKEALWKLW